MALQTILFLGDSITLGTPGWPTAVSGWRGEFLRALPGLFPTGELATNPVSPVDGSGNAISTSKNLHDGHSGLWPAFIYTNLLPGIWDVAAAQRVTILLGANSISQGISPAQNAADIANIIDYIHGRSPLTRIWVAGVTNWRSDQTAYNPILDAQRPLVQAVSDARPTFCTYVTMPTLLDSEFSDTIHPNAAGYTRIANAWIAAFKAA
jgi:lysophospholipase L1-like esterase